MELDQPHASDERAITKRAIECVGRRIHPIAQALREAAHILLGREAHGRIGVRRNARERSDVLVGQWADARLHIVTFLRYRAPNCAPETFPVMYDKGVTFSATVDCSGCLRARRSRLRWHGRYRHIS